MTWAAAPTAAKYRTAEHRNKRAALVRHIKRYGSIECTAIVCLFDRAPITNTDGRDDDGLNLGHEDDGVRYRGAEHRACNLRDAAVRANARSRGASPAEANTARLWVL